MTDQAAQYRSALDNSLSTTLAAIHALRNNHTSSLADIQHELTLDTVTLTRAKNEFKRKHSKISALLESTVSASQNPNKNPFALKYEQQRYANVLEWDSLRRTIDQIPSLKLDAIAHIIQPLPRADTDDIHNRLWSDEELQNLNNALVSSENSAKIEHALTESDKQKFKLVQLHDKYYQRKIAGLKESDRKWRSELAQLVSFVSTDVAKLKNDLQQKLNDAEEEEDMEASAFMSEPEAEVEAEADIDVEVEAEADIDVEGEAEAEADIDVEGEAEAEADIATATDADEETNMEVDAGIDANTNTNTNANADTDAPHATHSDTEMIDEITSQN